MHDIDAVRPSPTVAELEAELKVTEELLNDRQRVLDAIPTCADHGACVPHALEWIAQQRRDAARMAELERLCVVASDTMETVSQWLGMASTRQAASDALWRLTRALQRAGFGVRVHDDLRWRGSIIRACEQAGVGLDDDGLVMRVRMPRDAPHQHPSGPPLTPDRLRGYVLQHGTARDRDEIEGRGGVGGEEV